MEYTTELQHYGVQGMHWGVRRYQNENGTLTPMGKKKLAKAEYYRDKSDEYKSKIPSHYLTTFGQHKARKYTEKALAAEGKAIKIEKEMMRYASDIVKAHYNDKLSEISK